MRFVDTRLVAAAGSVWIAQYLTIVVGPLVALLSLGAALLLGASVLRRVLAVDRVAITRMLAVLLVSCVGAIMMAQLRSSALTAEPLPALIAHNAVAEAVVVLAEPPRLVASSSTLAFSDQAPATRWTARASLVHLRENDHLSELDVPVTVHGGEGAGSMSDLLPGSVIEFVAAVAEPGGRMGSAAQLRVRGEWQLIAPAPAWQQAAAAVRAGLVAATANMASDPGGLLPGLVVGDESELPVELREAMGSVGLSHLTAVSGANIAIVAGLVLGLARLLRVPKVVAAAAAATTLLGYLLVVGSQPSVLRATAMGLLALLAIALSRQRHGLSLVATAVFALLLVDPWLSVSVGFALSVVATVALLGVGSPRATRSVTLRVYRAALLASAAAGVATAPLIVALGEGLPVYTVPANMAAMAAVPLATILGFVALILAPVSPNLAEVAATVAGYPTGWVAVVARFGSGLPGATFAWPSGATGFGLAVLAIVGVLLALGHYRRCPPTTRGNLKRVYAALIAAVIVGISVNGRESWVTDWQLVMCDVGQGDAVVLNAGPGTAVVIDAGPEPAAVDRCLADLGVSRIGLLVLTHFHVDHVGGLAGVLHRRRVDRVIVSPLAEPADQARRVNDQLRDLAIPAAAAQLDESGQIGAVSYRLVWPAGPTSARESAPNNASVTMLAHVVGMDVLLTGDLEPSAQRAMLNRVDVNEVDVVKIPHHGSKRQEPALVAAASSARVALASAGRGNRYGHPAPETIDSWRTVGAHVLRTDVDGDVALLTPTNSTLRWTVRGSDQHES